MRPLLLRAHPGAVVSIAGEQFEHPGVQQRLNRDQGPAGQVAIAVARTGPIAYRRGMWEQGGDRDRSNGDRITVYLLDDHEVVRRGIRDLLQSEGDIDVVGESGLAQEAARRIPALRPDVAILDA